MSPAELATQNISSETIKTENIQQQINEFETCYSFMYTNFLTIKLSEMQDVSVASNNTEKNKIAKEGIKVFTLRMKSQIINFIDNMDLFDMPESEVKKMEDLLVKVCELIKEINKQN